MKLIILILSALFSLSLQAQDCDCGKFTGYHFDKEKGICDALSKGDEEYVYNCYQFRKDPEIKKITCQFCITGFSLDPQNNKCIKHEQENCINPQFISEKFQCLDGCKGGKIYDKTNKKCIESTADLNRCIEIVNDSGKDKCEKCSQGYYLDQTNSEQCQKNPESGEAGFLQNCGEYEHKSGSVKCKDCAQGYYMNPKVPTCVKVGDDANSSSDEFYESNCSWFMWFEDEQKVKCVECEQGYYLKYNSGLGKRECLANPTSGQPGYDANCGKYDVASRDPYCDKCREGYYKNSSSVCAQVAQVVEGCMEYVKNGVNVECYGCQLGKFTIDNYQTCKICPAKKSPKVMPQPEEEPIEPENSGAGILKISGMLIFLVMGIIL